MPSNATAMALLLICSTIVLIRMPSPPVLLTVRNSSSPGSSETRKSLAVRPRTPQSMPSWPDCQIWGGLARGSHSASCCDGSRAVNSSAAGVSHPQQNTAEIMIQNRAMEGIITSIWKRAPRVTRRPLRFQQKHQSRTSFLRSRYHVRAYKCLRLSRDRRPAR